MKEPSMRELTLGILLEVTAGNAYSHIAIRNVLDKYAYLDERTRSQIRRLSSGTLEKLIQLDYILNLSSKTKTGKMKPVILNILRMAVYEMLYMDGIPIPASVNEAVKLAEKKGFRNLKGFVNGVLRSVARSLPDLRLPEDLSIRYAVPEWILRLWISSYGKEKTEEILKGFESEAPLTVHSVSAAMSEETLFSMWEREQVSYEETEIPHAFRITAAEALPSLPSFQRGGYFVQDLSSMKAMSALPLTPGMKILDVCGAPGGKSLFLADGLLRLGQREGAAEENDREDENGLIVCRDLSEEKVSRINENIRRCVLKNCRAEVYDAQCYDPEWEKKADAVIADLPCSGLGVLGRKPDIKLRQSEDSLKALASLQHQILSVVRSYVKPGGYLLYSTCTINRNENEENVRLFLKENPGFSLVSMEQLLPIAGRQDGFFYALLKSE